MKLIQPSATLIWITTNPLQVIELAGRTAYKSEDKITPESAEKFVERILYDLKHESVIEHASASIKFICDRGVTHEIVRHRLFSYTQESTRYCNYSKDKFENQISVIQPMPHGALGFKTWLQQMQHCEDAYLEMIGEGITPQIARSVLPTCLKTEIVVTGNFRQWRHFFKLRTASNAHPAMQEIAKLALGILRNEVKIVFDKI